MTVRMSIWMVSGTLALTALPAAHAQLAPPAVVRDYSGAVINGVLSHARYWAPLTPTTWTVPQYVIHYAAQPPVYVPIAAPRPAVEAVPTAMLTLRSGSSPVDLGVTRGTVVTIVNGSDRERTLVVQAVAAGGTGSRTVPTGRSLRPNAGLSLAFHRPGAYEYYLQDEPERRGRIVVGG